MDREAREKAATEAAEKLAALFKAVVDGSLETVGKLIDEGMDVDTRDDGERTPLIFASLQGDGKMVELLLDKGADINAWEKENGLNALDVAILEGHTELVEFLIARGADINARNKRGGTPLMLAAFKGFGEIVGILIDKGAVVDTQDKVGNTALSLAEKQSHTEIAEALRNAGTKG